ncbi:MAG: oligosaccharide flippase family protein [Pseudothermotoga sp.]|uniref:oligosaccharide flippase family protein n=1 Tax=Thermotoga sp. Ku-13t TaxID=1755813 RepID=UPI0013ED07D0|nr:oligosaccharide flippase family protein [Thermotoga sp. Ku-13t]KAF2958125.1 polysaccharide biosynthesis protein [Thermotoga sp. Ku-13t]KAF2958144.1 polysaccharide biosynthesis protein [Thermotoga sp. Ku-13t]
MLKSLKNDVKLALGNGFAHIFTANVVNKIIQFGTSIVVVRIVSKEIYGQWSYANNILNFFLLLSGLGVASGLLQFASSSANAIDKLSYLKYSLRVGASFNLLIATALFCLSWFIKLPLAGSVEILRWLSFLPVFTISFDITQSFLRAELKNAQFSIVTMVNTFSLFLGILVFGYYYQVKGLILSRYIAYFITLIIAGYMLKPYLSMYKTVSLPDSESRNHFLKFSITAMLSNVMSQILYLIDVLLVGLIVKSDTVVATYKTSTLVPFALNFIPLSVMTYVYPYFARKKMEKQWIKERYRRLVEYLLLLNSCISVFLIITAPLVIRVLFGSKYLDAVTTFRILAFGYLIAGTFRIPAGNILASLGKVEVNLWNAIISGIANVILDAVLIKVYGAIGAAVATVLVFLISSLFGSLYLKRYLS